MTTKIVTLAILSVILSALCIYLFMQRQPLQVILPTAAGAVTGWIAVICRGKLPAWLQVFWSDSINDDFDPANLPVRVWLPVLLGGMIILGVIIVCVLGL